MTKIKAENPFFSSNNCDRIQKCKVVPLAVHDNYMYENVRGYGQGVAEKALRAGCDTAPGDLLR